MTSSPSLTRRIVGGTGIIMAASLVMRLVGIVASPITTRLYAPESYGAAAAVTAMTEIFGMVAVVGLEMGYARYALTEGLGEEIERFCWRAMLSTGLVSAVLGHLLWALVVGRTLTISSEYGVAIALGVFANATYILAVTRRRLMGGYRRIAAAIVASGLATTGGTIGLALCWRRDAWPLVLATVVSCAVQIPLLGVPSLPALLARPKLPPGFVRKVYSLGLPTMVTMPAYWVLTSADRWFLTGLGSKEIAGIYTVAFKFGMTGALAISAMNMVWYPELSRVIKAASDAEAKQMIGRLWARLVFMFAVVWLTTAAAGGDAVRLLTAAQYHSGAVLVPWMGLGCFFYAIASIGWSGMFVTGSALPVIWWWALGCVLSLGMNWLLVPRLGALASALAMAAAFAVIGIGVVISGQKRWRMQIPWRRLAAAGGVIAVTGAALSPAWHEHPVVSLAIKLPIGAALAALAFRVIAPDWFQRALNWTAHKTRRGPRATSNPPTSELELEQIVEKHR